MQGYRLNYEARTKKSYSELKKGLGKWAATYYKGSIRNSYSDGLLIYDIFTKSIINSFKNKELKIIDFGGGDGILLNIIKKQLKEQGISTKAINLDINKKNIMLCKKKYPSIKTKKWDITKIYKKDAEDVGLCRFVLQYLDKGKKSKFYRVAYSTLKKNGILIVLWPANKNIKIYNKFLSEIISLISKESTKIPQQYPSINEVKKSLKNNGFNKIKQIKLNAKLFTSPTSWMDRFHINKNDLIKINKIYETYFLKYPYLFKKRKKSIYLISNLSVIEAKK